MKYTVYAERVEHYTATIEAENREQAEIAASLLSDDAFECVDSGELQLSHIARKQ